jgi:RimJ/RimL family protein N-acetyltransferase
MAKAPEPLPGPGLRNILWTFRADREPRLSETEENCERAMMRFKEQTDFRLHLFLKDSDILIGSSGLHNPDWSIPKFEIGYWVRTSYSGRGYITEAVREISQFAFENLNANRVEIRTSTRNIKAWRIPELLGFTLEGVLRNDSRHSDGTLRDTKVYSKIRDDGSG